MGGSSNKPVADVITVDDNQSILISWQNKYVYSVADAF